MSFAKPNHKKLKKKNAKVSVSKQIYWSGLTYFRTGYTCKALTDVPNSSRSKKQIPGERRKENVPKLAKLQLQRLMLWPLRDSWSEWEWDMKLLTKDNDMQWPPKRVDLWGWSHLIRVMRRHDLLNKKEKDKDNGNFWPFPKIVLDCWTWFWAGNNVIYIQ